MTTPVRERTDTDILLHLCRALAFTGALTNEGTDSRRGDADHERERTR